MDFGLSFHVLSIPEVALDYFAVEFLGRVVFAFDEVEHKPNFAYDFAELVSLCKVMF